MFRNYLLIIFLCLLGACSTKRPPFTAPVDTGFQLQIRQAFTDLPNGTHIDFQLGRRVLSGNLDRWTTYCRLYVYNRSRGADYVTSIIPGSFQVSAVDIGYVSSDYPGRPGAFGHLSRGVRDNPAYYLYHVEMRLTSPDQPDLRSLNCYKKWATPRAYQYPTLAEIRSALGDGFRLAPIAP